MENENPIQYRKTYLLLIILLWIYTAIHLGILLYFFFTEIYHSGISEAEMNGLLIFGFLFISFLSTAILVTVNYCRNVCNLKISLIPSIINELIFIGVFLFALLLIFAFGIRNGSDFLVLVVVIILFLIESTPNIILYILICKKSRNKRTPNLNNNNISIPLVNQ